MTNAILWLSVLVYGAALALFVAAMRRRWFSRRRNGFLLSMLLGLGVAGVGSTVMVGVWGHAAADDLLSRQIVTELAAMEAEHFDARKRRRRSRRLGNHARGQASAV